MSKINFKNKINIILINFQIKNTLKSKYYCNVKQTLNHAIRNSFLCKVIAIQIV